MGKIRIRRVPIVVAAIGAVLTSDAVRGQNCAQCYQSAAASGNHFVQALRSGILILISAPLIVCTAIAILAYRKRSSFRE
jgi:hypothetical protein